MWNLRTEAAQTPVSMLGKIFKTTLSPLKLLKETSANSVETAVKLGDTLPTFGNSPSVWIVLPFSVIVAIKF
ncbi:hypothetical protein CCYN74_200016 [Capnocytophaga cynodegmi]|uniref:Uncharacterized protein n=1 Tax=Capnocytophaga cynodegmi TaxID=28189 RepID=A0A0B7HAX2_9FLAO|nr:hypothetical protein CCYN74_200016 [Capnocytophaga cynodegmi]